MIEGKGMIAQAFQKYKNNENIFIFASGVSNSLEIDKDAFLREKDLLNKRLSEFPNAVFVYFSTCSIYDSSMQNSNYVQHKLEMEKIITQGSNSFYIFRLPQVVGKSNSPTLVNYLVNTITNEQSFDIWEGSTRNLIDVEDVFKIINFIIEKQIFLNEITNIASSKSYYIKEIVLLIENILGIEAKYSCIDKGASYKIDTQKIYEITKELLINFNDEYMNRIIRNNYVMESR
jgi:nucleoside-diphosphate-sugar epimerase